jgi:hypothetical protein
MPTLQFSRILLLPPYWVQLSNNLLFSMDQKHDLYLMASP